MKSFWYVFLLLFLLYEHHHQTLMIEIIGIDIKNLNYKCNKKLMVVKECVCVHVTEFM